jgi:hypothetical protein
MYIIFMHVSYILKKIKTECCNVINLLFYVITISMLFIFKSKPGCIPCKHHAEDTPILTIDSIVICQTHAEDLRRIALKMHPGE